MKKVSFPIYFEAVARAELVLPDYVDADDEDDVRAFIENEWGAVQIPAEFEYIGDTGFDWQSPIEISDV